MAAGGVIGMATATVAGFYVLPFLAGAYVAGHCILITGRIVREEKLYKDIETRVVKILEKSDAL